MRTVFMGLKKAYPAGLIDNGLLHNALKAAKDTIFPDENDNQAGYAIILQVLVIDQSNFLFD